MSFLLDCPHCGSRPVTEFAFGSEIAAREPSAQSTLAEELYLRDNVAGIEREWWFHRCGCESWFIAERDTTTNEVLRTTPAGVA
jgi:heterotetrameric sarcosine oxidase delta subunit